MIEGYIPSPPDPSLDPGEYYYLQNNRVIRVWICDILPYANGTEYGIYQERAGQLVRIDAGYGDPNHGVRMSQLYDNKDDCREQTHLLYDHWENLRFIQRRDKQEET